MMKSKRDLHLLSIITILLLFTTVFVGTFSTKASAAVPQKKALFITDNTMPSYTINQNLSQFRDLLINNGYQVNQFTPSYPYPNPPQYITASDLESYDVVAFATVWAWPGEGPQRDLSADEIRVFNNYVNNGGGLLLIGENSGFTRWNTAVSSIGQNFGITVDPSVEYDDEYGGTITNLASHPITQGINLFHISDACALSVSNPAIPIATAVDGKPVLAAAEFGSGRVVAISDINVFSNYHYNMYPELPALNLNIMEWLAAAGPSTMYSITTSIDGGHGTATAVPTQVQPNGSSLITFTPDVGYHLLKVTINGTDITASVIGNTYTIHNIQQNQTVVASFAINTYNISANVYPSSSGSITGIGTYNHGDQVTLTATASANYHFVGWSEGSTDLGTANPLIFTVVGPRNLVANFVYVAPIPLRTISTVVNPISAGTITGGGTYADGMVVNLTASANQGYRFVNWTVNGSPFGNTPSNHSISFIADSDKIITANFERIPNNGLEMISQIKSYFKQEAATGRLTGASKNAKIKNAENRINAFYNKLEEIEQLIRQGDIGAALVQLESAYAKVDGEMKNPPDFIQGTSAPELASKILSLINLLKSA